MVDGKLPANRKADLTATVSDIAWEPNRSIFLLGSDVFVGSGENDGLAVDNVRFSAVPKPMSVALLAVAATAFTRRRRRSI